MATAAQPPRRVKIVSLSAPGRGIQVDGLERFIDRLDRRVDGLAALFAVAAGALPA